MSDNVLLYDADGNPLVLNLLKEISREQLAENIFKTNLASDESEGFINALLTRVPLNEEGQLAVPLSDTNIQNFIIGYGASKIINQALDENLSKGYGTLFTYIDPVKYPDDGVIEVGEDTLKELKNIYANIAPEMVVAQDICDVQSEIYTTLRGYNPKQVTSFQANRIQEKFEDLTQYLNYEQIAAGYYNISIIHRALLAEKDVYNPKDNNSEKECLYKVIENTSDYKRIHYCVNRLGPNYKDRGAVRAAYRRALAQTTVPADLCKIHIALAECYIADNKPTVGYSGKEDNEDMLLRAQMHYEDALKYAQDPEKPALIKKIGAVQLQQGKIDEWTETQTFFAMKILKGEERIHTLLKIAGKNSKLSKEYLEFALEQTLKSRKIEKIKKKPLVARIAHYLRPIYEKENNNEALEKIDATLAKFKSGKFFENPLQKYNKTSKTY